MSREGERGPSLLCLCRRLNTRARSVVGVRPRRPHASPSPSFPGCPACCVRPRGQFPQHDARKANTKGGASEPTDPLRASTGGVGERKGATHSPARIRYGCGRCPSLPCTPHAHRKDAHMRCLLAVVVFTGTGTRVWPSVCCISPCALMSCVCLCTCAPRVLCVHCRARVCGSQRDCGALLSHCLDDGEGRGEGKGGWVP